MYELIQISEHDYYIDCPAKMGIVKISDTDVIMIDSGNDKDAGKKALRHIEGNGWKLKAIYNTHSHADHIGGNKFIQGKTNCDIYAAGLEMDFTNNPILEPMNLYGGFPFKDLKHKFMMAQESICKPLTKDSVPEGFEIIPLPGHSFDQVGFKTPDGNIFLADCISSKDTLDKYGIGYLFDVASTLATLENVKVLTANQFIPAHAAVSDNISELAQYNTDCILGVCDKILGFCEEPIAFDCLLKKVFDAYGLMMSAQQFVLIGSTVRSYLAYLYSEGKVTFAFDENVMKWAKA